MITFYENNTKTMNTDEKNLKLINFYLSKYSKDRYELRKAKNGIIYIYDFDYREVSRSKNEIIDICSCILFNNVDSEDIPNILDYFTKNNLMLQKNDIINL